ncbi:hypothetical protein [Nocardioides marmoribigeumensis]|uniref:Anti-sigma-M factor RsmA n=1 Tax=Nocardioides marmoribigeumensis TaxID=433649 RepID=A0ABU2BUL8_9ACTN|nr:hypothetical protein [Nocardioides marmoribigeumensis]MDR7362320.1 hypothetical protein [Nocardioides marmoribigeumensis]
MSTEHDPVGPGDPVDPEEQAFVRALLGEVGREPEPLPPDVAERLDDVLAGLVVERTAGERAAGGADAPGSPAVVPLERARRRRRALAGLVAAAAVVVGGWSLTTSGLLTGSGGSADSAGGASGALPEAALGSQAPGSFTMSSDSLRADARRLVGSDPAQLARLESSTQRLSPLHDQADAAQLPTTDTGGAPGPSRVPAGRCLDPLAPARLPRLAVTYDGRAATAVLRPERPTASGRDRVRVEVWSCTAPARLASVVVPR